MKFLALSLALALSPTSFAGTDNEEFPVGGIDAEVLDVYTINKVDMPTTIVMRTNMKDGKCAIYQSAERTNPGIVKDDGFVDVEYSDDVDFQAPDLLNIMQRGSYGNWHHDRNRGFGYYHRYRNDHPYGSYYGRHYMPPERRHYAYSGAPYRYRPYHHYSIGDSIYRFFERIFD